MIDVVRNFSDTSFERARRQIGQQIRHPARRAEAHRLGDLISMALRYSGSTDATVTALRSPVPERF